MEGQPPGAQRQRLRDRPGPVLQADQLLDMQAVAGAVGQLVHADAVGLHDAHAGQARARLGRDDAPHRLALQVEQRLGGVADIDRGQDDRRALELFAHRGPRGRLGAERAQPAPPGLQPPRRGVAAGALGQRHLVGMAEIVHQVRGAGMAVLGLHLQAAQDDLLQPRRAVRPQPARRHRRLVEPLAQAAHAGGRAEGPLAGGQVVEHHAQREQVRARLAAQELHLLGRHVGHGAHRQVELLVEQIGQVVMAAQAVVDQHRLAARTEQDVARLDVEMDDVLAVQVVQRRGHPRADRGDLVDRQRRRIQLRAQRVAGDVLHDDVGPGREVALGDEARHMHAAQHRQDHHLDLEADDGGRILAALDARHLHQHRQPMIRMRHPPQAGHAALVQPLLEQEAVDQVAHAEVHAERVAVHHRPPPLRRRPAAARPARGAGRRR